MYNYNQLVRIIADEKSKEVFARLYGNRSKSQPKRYMELLRKFGHRFGRDSDGIRFFSTPGRTEICGNHTDHNHGMVIAAGVNLDIVAAAAPNDSGVIRIKSEGYKLIEIDISDLSVKNAEKNKSPSMVRGIVAGFKRAGYRTGGFDAFTSSDILKGSGLSSSAAFEVIVGTMLNFFYNDSAVTPVEIAKISQYAEREYFGKPSGLMDQTACAVGGVIAIDFRKPSEPVIETIDCDMSSRGYRLCIVDTKGNHSRLTGEYAAITDEMAQVSRLLGVDYLRETDIDSLISKAVEIRRQLGDRAYLRAMHYFAENKRVQKQTEALKKGDIRAFLRLINESGNSSAQFLQNIFPARNIKNQSLYVALSLASYILDGQGACRVHGGGFGGTTQNFVPANKVKRFKKTLEDVFGEGSCLFLETGRQGGTVVF
ncbi:MAG: galactokinase [Oscillospiraceae bacterium]|nr:galactokinase [Oscillospiraceae bacterium]